MSNQPKHGPVSVDEMMSRVVRFKDLVKRGIPVMFIDSVLPGHYRMNYAVVGDTASENPEFQPYLTQPHRFQIGMFCAMPGCGPAYHNHDYCEMFLVLTGRWRFYFGNDPEGEPEGDVILEPWDSISFPPGIWRGFENIGDEPAWSFAVLDPHDVFREKDPYWAPQVERAAAEMGFHADESGKMIPPENYAEIRQQLYDMMAAQIKELRDVEEGD